MQVQPLSEQAIRLMCEAIYAYDYISHEEGLLKLDNMLKTPDLLDEHEREYFLSTHQIWRAASDPNFLLSLHPSATSDINVLFVKSQNFLKEGNYAEAMRYGWLKAQYSAFGTSAFLQALSYISEVAALMEDTKFARDVAQLFLSHYDLMLSASASPLTPVSKEYPTPQHEWFREDEDVSLYLPAQTALERIGEDPSPCWARILAIELDTASLEIRNQAYYQKVITALREYYKKVGDISNLEFLPAYEVVE